MTVTFPIGGGSGATSPPKSSSSTTSTIESEGARMPAQVDQADMETPAGIELHDVTKTFMAKRQRVDALGGVSLTVDRNQFVSLIGRSGCGKSTVLRLLA